ncbi:GerAB/ArcD/ProY family transporter [Pseudalkalibacillus caeni]|uniref:Spore gernimation protein GerB n=1 Tax=Exobacillus caeni TaxID=2574798 RepID=A0A5R9FC74_9BACL|nr:GerAB/ArcD/ProY family transporter [Pseudalkalibacillus caeni]TLS38154.1 spore gernimation protein GerB [Pseudalkalibacillus caeni]
MKVQVNDQNKISPNLVFFLIHAVQVGVGILGFQRYIAEKAGYDAWISVLLAGIGGSIIIKIMYSMLLKEEGDLIEIHRTAFGNTIGNILSVLFLIYYFMMALAVLRTYIEVVQVWMFPQLSIFPYAFAFLGLVYYIVAGGIRTVTGIAFMGVVFPLYLILTIVFPLRYADFGDLLPIFSHAPIDILAGVKSTTLSYLGFTTLLMYFPFINDKRKSHIWAQLGFQFTTILYLLVAVVTFAFFSKEQLATTIWPTLTMFKIVEMPFVERFEYIGISSWALIILPNVCISVWAFSRGLKRVFHMQQYTGLKISIIALFILMLPFKDRQAIDQLNNYVSTIGFYVLYAYIPCLAVVYHVVRKVRDKHEA